MSGAALLGIDIGSTNLKVMAFDPEGRPLAERSAPTPVQHPRPGWSDYNPEALWQTALRLLGETVAALEPGRVPAGVAVASIGESGVPLDAAGEPTHPSIAWFDTRTRPEAEWLLEHLGQDRIYESAGLPPEPIYSLCKLLWLKRHAPEAWQRTTAWLHVADYIAWRLCGERATDFTLASRTLALHLRSLRWADDVLEAAGVSPGLLAPLAASGTALGRVRPEVCAASGLPPETVVGVGGHDHALGAIAAGAMEPGVMLDSMGTAEAAFLPLEAPVPEAALGRAGYSQGALGLGERRRYYILHGIYTSGACIEWFLDSVGEREGHAELIRQAEQVPPGSRGACFLPHLRLAGAPNRDARARGAFVGLTTEHDRPTLYRALLEGLAFEYRHTVDPLQAYASIPALQRILAIGGNSRNGLLVRTKATVMHQPIDVVHMAESTCLGAAVCGGLAAGIYGTPEEAVAGLQREHTRFEPEADWSAVLDARYERVYKHLYGTLRPLSHALADENAAL